jgi:deoxyribodipyrimidine photo-lyase
MKPPVIVWFRRDLRLADNPALSAAADGGGPVLPVYIHDPAAGGAWAMGAASRWWLHGSLQALGEGLAASGARLLLRRGGEAETIGRLAAEVGARAVVWNRRVTPDEAAADRAARAVLERQGVAVEEHDGALLFPPGAVRTAAGTPFRVFTPFWRALLARAGEIGPPLPAARRLAAADLPAGDRLEDWRLRPTRPDWAGGLARAWTPGEAGARRRLAAFLDGALAGYAADRDRPGREGTSRLSAHLHFGEISVRQVWHAVAAADDGEGRHPERHAGAYQRELVWREFAHHLLEGAPAMPEEPLDRRFATFPWSREHSLIEAWRRGRTGYPLVDAGMRQLWQEGWMHNRVRMVAASFLVKHLLQPWQEGERWFWDTLVDADLANNATNWQWVAGCGADAAPFFRIFNPTAQARAHDADGAYVRRWVPELAGLSDEALHEPWTATPLELKAAGVELGRTYPLPVVDHAAARRRALEAFASIGRAG